MKLQEILKRFREENNLSMQEFADRSGLSKGYISMLESGKHPQSQRPLTPSIMTYQKVAAAMGIPIDDLLRMVDGDEAIEIGGYIDPVLKKQHEEINDLFDRLPPAIRTAYLTILREAAQAQQAPDDPKGAG
jgi:transcriptional regulator with XRE-family HTH domain